MRSAAGSLTSVALLILAACGDDSGSGPTRDAGSDSGASADVVDDAAGTDAGNGGEDTGAPDAPDNEEDTAVTDTGGGGEDTGSDDTGGGTDSGGSTDSGGGSDGRYVRYTVATEVGGPAYVNVADVNGDETPELVVSVFGALGLQVPNGEVIVYSRSGGLDSWTAEAILPESAGIKFPNGTTIADLDGDDDLDVVVTAGFLVCRAIPLSPACGALGWLEQDGDSFAPHWIVPTGSELFYHHAELVDLDQDGIDDLVTVGESQVSDLFGMATKQAETQWFRGTSDDARFETTPRSIGPGLGSFPRARDIDGDGDIDFASAEYFVTGGSFAWYEQTVAPTADTAGTWVRHVIADDLGPSIDFQFVDNLTGDGSLYGVGSNHSNTAKAPPDPWPAGIFLFEIPEDPTEPWADTMISEGIVSGPGSIFAPQAAPGIFGVGDTDNDGDLDIVVSGDGDPRVFLLEQVAPGEFETFVLQEDLGQAGGMVVADLDDDGINEIVVTGYEDNVIYIFKWQP